MKKSMFRRMVTIIMALSLLCLTVELAGVSNVSAADYKKCPACGGSGGYMCGSCGGQGHTTISFPQQQVIGYNMGVPQYIYVQQTVNSPCTTCSGTGRMTCPSCSGTGRVNAGSNSSSSSSSDSSGTGKSSSNDFTAAANGTVLDATDGIGDYEDAPNLIDGKTETKFNVLSTSAYIIWKAPNMISVSSYTITTANDTATYTGRNPKTWVLYGSNKKLGKDDKGWKVIHSVTDDTKLEPANFKDFTYKLSKKSKPYQYFMLDIVDNKGADCTQLSEFKLEGKTVTVKKTKFTSVKRSGANLKLKWKKASGAKGYQIRYATSSKFKDGITVDVKGASKKAKTIKKLLKEKKYYVQIRAYKKVSGVLICSKWSKKKKV